MEKTTSRQNGWRSRNTRQSHGRERTKEMNYLVSLFQTFSVLLHMLISVESRESQPRQLRGTLNAAHTGEQTCQEDNWVRSVLWTALQRISSTHLVSTPELERSLSPSASWLQDIFSDHIRAIHLGIM